MGREWNGWTDGYFGQKDQEGCLVNRTAYDLYYLEGERALYESVAWPATVGPSSNLELLCDLEELPFQTSVSFISVTDWFLGVERSMARERLTLTIFSVLR